MMLDHAVARHGGTPEVQSPSDHLAVEVVTKRFAPSGPPALAAVSLIVRRGQFVAIVGPSGCGKSTLLRIVAGLEKPDAGAVSIFGETAERARGRKQIGSPRSVSPHCFPGEPCSRTSSSAAS